MRLGFPAVFRNGQRFRRELSSSRAQGATSLSSLQPAARKTLAAFLSVLSELRYLAEAGKLPNAVCAVYISPLKSLDRDIHRNLQQPLDAINSGLPEHQRVRIEVRTGDTEARDRGRQQRRRPHLLLTTPESLAALLSQRLWSDGFDTRSVIVDEIHSFAEGKRGTLLSLTMERLEAKRNQPLQRIGISATAWPISEVTRLLCGSRPCEVAAVEVKKAHRLGVAVPHPEEWLPPAGHNPYRVANLVSELVRRFNAR